MNRLTPEARTRVLSCLLEGSSIRSTVRMTGVCKKAVMRLLVETGQLCAAYQDVMFRDLKCRRVQVDEMWGFNYCKQKNVTSEIAAKVPGAGDVWLWVAIDADTKLVLAHLVAPRVANSAYEFMKDVAARMANPMQLTTDGLVWYPDAVDNAFGTDVHFGIVQKRYGTGGPAGNSGRYSPMKFHSLTKEVIKGEPDERHISTSFVERQNWTVRTTMRRYTRLSNGFSRKLENHCAAVALNYFGYNFIKIHRSLRTSPAMAAGVTDRLWDVSDLVTLLTEFEATNKAA